MNLVQPNQVIPIFNKESRRFFLYNIILKIILLSRTVLKVFGDIGFFTSHLISSLEEASYTKTSNLSLQCWNSPLQETRFEKKEGYIPITFKLCYFAKYFS
jgi:hypothetical protein